MTFELEYFFRCSETHKHLNSQVILQQTRLWLTFTRNKRTNKRISNRQPHTNTNLSPTFLQKDKQDDVRERFLCTQTDTTYERVVCVSATIRPIKVQSKHRPPIRISKSSNKTRKKILVYESMSDDQDAISISIKNRNNFRLTSSGIKAWFPTNGTEGFKCKTLCSRPPWSHEKVCQRSAEKLWTDRLELCFTCPFNTRSKVNPCYTDINSSFTVQNAYHITVCFTSAQ